MNIEGVRLPIDKIAQLCVKYLAWDEPVGESDLKHVKPLFDAQTRHLIELGWRPKKKFWRQKQFLKEISSLEMGRSFYDEGMVWVRFYLKDWQAIEDGKMPPSLKKGE